MCCHWPCHVTPAKISLGAPNPKLPRGLWISQCPRGLSLLNSLFIPCRIHQIGLFFPLFAFWLHKACRDFYPHYPYLHRPPFSALFFRQLTRSAVSFPDPCPELPGVRSSCPKNHCPRLKSHVICCLHIDLGLLFHVPGNRCLADNFLIPLPANFPKIPQKRMQFSRP